MQGIFTLHDYGLFGFANTACLIKLADAITSYVAFIRQ
jgi:hypothetical protein